MRGVFLRRRDAGGQQALVGVFVQDVFTPIPQLEIVGGVRGDYWLTYDGFRARHAAAGRHPAEPELREQ